MECRRYRDEIELYAIGGCDAARREEIRCHLADCAACAEEMAKAEAFDQWLAGRVRRVAPSIAEECPPKSVRAPFFIPGWNRVVVQGALAGIVIAVILYFLVFSGGNIRDASAAPNLSVSPTGPDRLELRWSRPEGTCLGFRILRSVDGADFTEISRVNEAATTFTDGGLATGTTYHYRICALTDEGSSSLSNTASARVGLINVSARGYVGRKTERLLAGFIIGSGMERKIVVRALGPSLKDRDGGIHQCLDNPKVEIRHTDGRAVARNDDWQVCDPLGAENNYRCGTPEDIIKAGLAPRGTDAHLESVILITLPPGTYSAVVEGVNGAVGVGLVEIFDIE